MSLPSFTRTLNHPWLFQARTLAPPLKLPYNPHLLGPSCERTPTLRERLALLVFFESQLTVRVRATIPAPLRNRCDVEKALFVFFSRALCDKDFQSLSTFPNLSFYFCYFATACNVYKMNLSIKRHLLTVYYILSFRLYLSIYISTIILNLRLLHITTLEGKASK